MDDKAFRDQLNQLVGKLENLTGLNAGSAAQKAEAQNDAVAAGIDSLRDSLTNLRLSVKYLIFDLEATRRENAYLRKLLAAQDDDRE